MKKKEATYWNLFKSTFTLSAFTFGGGYVIVPLMRKKFVEEFGWIDEEEMMDLVSIAQSSPGAMAVNTSIIVGYRMLGLPGALISVVGTVLPPLVIITVISFFYEAFSTNPYVQKALAGMQISVAAIIIDVVIDLATKTKKDLKTFGVIMMILVFLAVYVFKVQVLYVVLVCGLIGVLRIKRQQSVGEMQ